MRISTRLFIHVLGFAFNFNAIVLFSLLREPLIVVIALASMMISWSCIHHTMKFLDACEEATEEKDHVS